LKLRLVDFDFAAPEAESNFSSGIELAQIELTPAVEAGATEEVFDGVRFMLPMRPEPYKGCV